MQDRNLPVDAARPSGRRLGGAVGAEVPAVDLIDPRQLPGRTGRGGPAAARTRRRISPWSDARPTPALVTVPTRLGMR